MSAAATFEKGQQALRLYRRIMKLHIRNMPNDLRLFGDLYVKQEFRLHLDSASEDQMNKFIFGWEGYAKQIEQVDHKKGPKHIKKVLANDDYDEVLKEKFSDEQFQTLNGFKTLIYESEKKKKDSK